MPALVVPASPEVQADPARMRVWQANADMQRAAWTTAQDARTVYEVRGCGQRRYFLCAVHHTARCQPADGSPPGEAPDAS